MGRAAARGAGRVLTNHTYGKQGLSVHSSSQKMAVLMMKPCMSTVSQCLLAVMRPKHQQNDPLFSREELEAFLFKRLFLMINNAGPYSVELCASCTYLHKIRAKI